MNWGVDYAYNEWLERNKEMDGERIIRFYERNKFYKWFSILYDNYERKRTIDEHGIETNEEIENIGIKAFFKDHKNNSDFC